VICPGCGQMLDVQERERPTTAGPPAR
jgi:hypothetical protein